jgi:hypothetical protein
VTRGRVRRFFTPFFYCFIDNKVQLKPHLKRPVFNRFGTWSSLWHDISRHHEKVLAVVCQLVVGITDPIGQ